MEKKKFFGANFKQNEIFQLLNYPSFEGNEKSEVVAFVPSFFLSDPILKAISKTKAISRGAQDISEFTGGSYTAEPPSPTWLKQAGITDTLIGHSEQRQHYEDLGVDPQKINQMFYRKIAQAINKRIRVTYCIGETADERARGATEGVLETQIREGLENLALTDPTKLIIAYEPRWVIGTDQIPTSTQIKRAHSLVKEYTAKNLGYASLSHVTAIYGGNMNPENAREILAIPHVDGGLIGRESHNPERFAEIVNTV